MTRQKAPGKLPTLLTCQELADRSGLGRSTWYDLITTGQVPSYRIGRAVRVAEEDAAKYLASCREVVR